MRVEPRDPDQSSVELFSEYGVPKPAETEYSDSLACAGLESNPSTAAVQSKRVKSCFIVPGLSD